ncbi:PTS sugar transporter subunit IIA [Pelosinus propionicus]|uniref:PTS system IIA component, Gat family n=1 Tax=Pelosinus propionicus DSM 13327 TaxID=1123291 RepID=A0A1I4H3L8_9FIRM|nr:PTS sugar transporter subunit IIA [Pelosinus propionicus]SFL36795.1 PTS system IIA component, Gat family [Pelosinus propionicus DSM 13327]
MLDLDLVILHMEAETSNEIIQNLGALMFAKGYVRDSYIKAVLERERNLPTGLPIGDFCVAIPHTDSGHVNRSTIAITTLKKPTIFHSMVNPEEILNVEVVFLLAVKDPNLQIQLLKNLMSVFQNKELLIKVRDASSKEEISELLSCLDQ